MSYTNDYTRDGADALLAHVRALPPEERWRRVRDEATSAMQWCASERVSPHTLPIPNRVWVAQMMIAELGEAQESAAREAEQTEAALAGVVEVAAWYLSQREAWVAADGRPADGQAETLRAAHDDLDALIRGLRVTT